MIGKKYEPRKTYIDGKEFNAQEFNLTQILRLTPGLTSWIMIYYFKQKPRLVFITNKDAQILINRAMKAYYYQGA